ncbi:hypothetical protein ABHF91_07040 [Pseudaeromonas sp. ZJS20]|uniref:hypothetical protein n=1 Tax=Pseudaeromonas aegiceratis TaxID=3153928 RepID=UPI00390C9699
MHLDDMTDTELWTLADAMMDNLMAASTAIDHAGHTRDFTPRLKNLVTPEYLQQVCRQYQQEKGFFTQRSPVALFRRPDSVAFVWRQGFSRVAGDYVAELVLVHADEGWLIDHVMVF